MSRQVATGSFEITFAPADPYDTGEGVTLTQMTGDKRFSGDIEGMSTVHMTSAVGQEEGSAGYVVIEKVIGTVHGRAGGFVLQHFGLMDRGAPELRIDVVPGTGFGELTGIRGSFAIAVVDGRHDYSFTYELPTG